MYPVLFSINKLHVSSFGVLITLGFLFGMFLIWRLARAWDLDEEKILDLTLLTFLGGLLGSRIYYTLEHLQFFAQNPIRFFYFTKYPGFSFWGAFLGGWLALNYFARKKRLDFWQVADIAAVGFLGGLIFTSLGCFLGGCDVGIVSKVFFAVPVVGLVGKRFPVQLLGMFLLTLALLNLWGKSKRFHPRGAILGLVLIFVGAIKVLVQPLKAADGENLFLSLILIILGVYIYYKVTNKNLKQDLKDWAKYIISLFTDPLARKSTVARLGKYWYNRKTSISWKLRSLKKALRRINVKFSYKDR